MTDDTFEIVKNEELVEHHMLQMYKKYIGRMIDHLTAYVVEGLSEHQAKDLEAQIEVSLNKLRRHVNTEGNHFEAVLKRIKKMGDPKMVKVVKRILKDIGKEYDKIEELMKQVDVLHRDASEHRVREVQHTKNVVGEFMNEIEVLTNELATSISHKQKAA
jgi:hypothetical protein